MFVMGDALQVRLERNYRSTAAIVDAARSVIRNNAFRWSGLRVSRSFPPFLLLLLLAYSSLPLHLFFSSPSLFLPSYPIASLVTRTRPLTGPVPRLVP
jgi:hypothetical protein